MSLPITFSLPLSMPAVPPLVHIVYAELSSPETQARPNNFMGIYALRIVNCFLPMCSNNECGSLCLWTIDFPDDHFLFSNSYFQFVSSLPSSAYISLYPLNRDARLLTFSIYAPRSELAHSFTQSSSARILTGDSAICGAFTDYLPCIFHLENWIVCI